MEQTPSTCGVVLADRLIAEGKIDVVTRAVAVAKEQGVPSGVGAHDLNVVMECERTYGGG